MFYNAVSTKSSDRCGSTATKNGIGMLLHVILVCKSLVQFWHGGRTTSEVSKSVCYTFRHPKFSRHFSRMRHMANEGNFVANYCNDEEVNTSDMAEKELLSRLYNEVTQILQRIHPTVGPSLESNQDHVDDRFMWECITRRGNVSRLYHAFNSHE